MQTIGRSFKAFRQSIRKHSLRRSGCVLSAALGLSFVSVDAHAGLELLVHPQTFQAWLANNSATDAIHVSGYEIRSAKGLLAVCSWEPITNAAANAASSVTAVLGSGALEFVKTPVTTSSLAELNIEANGNWGPNAFWNIGFPFGANGAAIKGPQADAEFEYVVENSSINAVPGTIRMLNCGGTDASKPMCQPPGRFAGDADNNGYVDGNDFMIWQRNIGKTSGGTMSTGDFDGDCDVDGNDRAVWQANFGAGGTSCARSGQLPGDADRDGDCDGNDFLVIQRSFGTASFPPGNDADFDGDCDVDINDLQIWKEGCFGLPQSVVSQSVKSLKKESRQSKPVKNQSRPAKKSRR